MSRLLDTPLGETERKLQPCRLLRASLHRHILARGAVEEPSWTSMTVTTFFIAYLASALTEPLEVVAVVTSFSFFYAGFAGAAALWGGAAGEEIANAAATGAAAGFIVGLFAGVAATLYLLLS